MKFAMTYKTKDEEYRCSNTTLAQLTNDYPLNNQCVQYDSHFIETEFECNHCFVNLIKLIKGAFTQTNKFSNFFANNFFYAKNCLHETVHNSIQ